MGICITGKKVILREATSEDLDRLYYWGYEEAKQEAKKWNGPYIIEPRLLKEEFLRNWANKRSFSLGVPSALVIVIDGVCIGMVSCYWVDECTDWLETGIVMYDTQYWNGGYGTEAYELWIEFLFTSTSLHRLGMSTWSGNVRMMKVAEKIGMQEEARIRQARIVNGVRFDAIKMGILRQEWEMNKYGEDVVEGKI